MWLAVSHTLTLHGTSCYSSLSQTHWGTRTQGTPINPALVFFITYPRQQLLHPSFPSVTEHTCFKTTTLPNLARAHRSWYTTPKMLLHFLTRPCCSPDLDLLGGLLHCVTGRTRQVLGLLRFSRSCLDKLTDTIILRLCYSYPHSPSQEKKPTVQLHLFTFVSFYGLM